MIIKRARLGWRQVVLAGVLLGSVSPAGAYLFWTRPALGGALATGTEPDLVSPLAGASAKESQANLIWTMRAGLNVAALQCQFAPALRTVQIYNNMLSQHAGELQDTYGVLSAYFRRTGGPTWQTKLDQYTTRTYNSFSTLRAQLVFCETAASIGRETLERPRGALGAIAAARMREFRNSLVPVGDAAFAVAAGGMRIDTPADLESAPQCVDKKGRPKPCKG